MKIDQRVQEIWSGHESVTDGLTDEWNSYNPIWLRGGGGLKLLLVSDGCFVLDLIPTCIIILYSAPLGNLLGFIFRYTHENLCTSEN